MCAIPDDTIVPLFQVDWYSVDTNRKLGYKAGYGLADVADAAATGKAQ